MKMKRTLAVLLSLVLMLGLLAGCGGGETPAPEEKEPQTQTGDLEEPKPTEEPEEININEYISDNWLYNFEYIGLSFYPDGTYDAYDPFGEYTGSYTFDGTLLNLYSGEDLIGAAMWGESDRLVFQGLNGFFYREASDVGYDGSNFSEENGILPNMQPGPGLHPLQNGMAVFDDTHYAAGTCDYEVLLTGEEITEDGIRVLNLQATAYLPSSGVPSNILGNFRSNCRFTFYDEYTGFAIDTIDYYEAEDGSYIYEFDTQGGRVLLTLTQEGQWLGQQGQYFNVLQNQFTITMPEWYDGLVYAALVLEGTRGAHDLHADAASQPIGLNILEYQGSNVVDALRFDLG